MQIQFNRGNFNGDAKSDQIFKLRFYWPFFVCERNFTHVLSTEHIMKSKQRDLKCQRQLSQT